VLFSYGMFCTELEELQKLFIICKWRCNGEKYVYANDGCTYTLCKDVQLKRNTRILNKDIAPEVSSGFSKCPKDVEHLKHWKKGRMPGVSLIWNCTLCSWYWNFLQKGAVCIISQLSISHILKKKTCTEIRLTRKKFLNSKKLCLLRQCRLLALLKVSLT
jgi:hypothetical protein